MAPYLEGGGVVELGVMELGAVNAKWKLDSVQ